MTQQEGSTVAVPNKKPFRPDIPEPCQGSNTIGWGRHLGMKTRVNGVRPAISGATQLLHFLQGVGGWGGAYQGIPRDFAVKVRYEENSIGCPHTRCIFISLGSPRLPTWGEGSAALFIVLGEIFALPKNETEHRLRPTHIIVNPGPRRATSPWAN
jgi:hypothetical protein